MDCPEGSADELVRLADKAGAKIKTIFVTHGHFDHVHDCAKLQKLTGARLVVATQDAGLLENPDDYGFGIETPASAPDQLAKDGDVLKAGSLSFAVMLLPGHSSGSCGLYCEKDSVLFSGDVLFAGGVGRTDLPGSDDVAMRASFEKLLELPLETIVYPGHGPETTIGDESAMLRQLLGARAL